MPANEKNKGVGNTGSSSEQNWVALQEDDAKNPLVPLFEKLGERVVGQPRAVEALQKSFEVVFAGINNPKKPLRVLMFLGPSRVGKTEMAYALSEILKPLRKQEIQKAAEETIASTIEEIENSKEEQLNHFKDEIESLSIRKKVGLINSAEFEKLKETIEKDKKAFLKFIENQLVMLKKELEDLVKHSLIRIDCQNFADRWNISSLTSSSPGYIGSGKPGLLDPAVINHIPWLVILFDEIERADPSLFDVLLRICDDGELQLASPVKSGPGHHDAFDDERKTYTKVIFRNCVIIMTSNLGSKEMVKFAKDSEIGFHPDKTKETDAAIKAASDMAYDICKRSYEKKFSQEFRNRVNKMIAFSYLSQDALRKILDLRIADLQEDSKIKFILQVPDEAKTWLLEQNDRFEEQAAGIQKVVDRRLRIPLARFLVQKDIQEDDTVEVRLNPEKQGEEPEKNLVFFVKKHQAS